MNIGQMTESLRLRLPLSYALIALLVAALTGLALLAIIRAYYTAQERDYLNANGQAIASNLLPLLAAGERAEVIEARMQTFSFLSRTRIVFEDAAGASQLTADVFDRQTVQFTAGISPDGSMAISPVETASPADTTGRETESQERTPAPEATPPAAPDEPTTGSFTLYLSDGELITAEGEADGQYRVSLVPTLYGYGFQQAGPALSSTARSTQSITVPVIADDGAQLGTLTLSGGPAYGVEIVNSVARGWLLASGVAVSLAITTGWFISRGISRPLGELTDTTTRMAGGDLSARVSTQQRGELGRLAASFNHMADQVEELVAALQRFVSNAAHEMKTPLTALRTNLELAAQHRDGDALQRALAEVERLNTLTNGLLELSRIEARVEVRPPERIDAAELLRETVSYYASRAEQADIALQLQLPPGPAEIQGHPDMLRRAIGNVLDNALKFTDAGGTVTAGLVRAGRHLEIRIQDTGTGIPPEDLPHLFNRFHRGRNAFNRPGSGLGLAIVQAIMEHHGGSAHAHNTHEGAQITLRLPQAE